jgi:putative endonuclease
LYKILKITHNQGVAGSSPAGSTKGTINVLFNFMAGCYIIHSKSLNKFYMGATQDCVYKRIEKHNLGGYGKNHYTATANDWTLFIYITADDYAHAIRLERKINFNNVENNKNKFVIFIRLCIIQ